MAQRKRHPTEVPRLSRPTGLNGLIIYWYQ